MKKILLATLCYVYTATGMPAAPIATTQNDAEMNALTSRLIDLTNLHNQLQLSVSNCLAAYPQSDEVVAIAQKAVDKLNRFMRSDEFLHKFQTIYKKYFTADEMKALISFYESSAGQKFINVMPQYMTEVMFFINPIMQDISTEMTAALDELQAKAATEQLAKQLQETQMSLDEMDLSSE